VLPGSTLSNDVGVICLWPVRWTGGRSSRAQRVCPRPRHPCRHQVHRCRQNMCPRSGRHARVPGDTRIQRSATHRGHSRHDANTAPRTTRNRTHMAARMSQRGRNGRNRVPDRPGARRPLTSRHNSLPMRHGSVHRCRSAGNPCTSSALCTKPSDRKGPLGMPARSPALGTTAARPTIVSGPLVVHPVTWRDRSIAASSPPKG